MLQRTRSYEFYYIRYPDGSYGYRSALQRISTPGTVIIAKFSRKVTGQRIKKYDQYAYVSRVHDSLRAYLYPNAGLQWVCDNRSEQCQYNIYGCEACTIQQ